MTELSKTDWTAEVAELEEARGRMQVAKKTARMEKERKLRAALKAAADDEVADIEYEFAAKLKRAHAAGMPQSIIRKHVLRTNVWDRWTYWRDMAEIEPERVSASRAKNLADVAWRGTLTGGGRRGDEIEIVNGRDGKPLPGKLRVSEWAWSEELSSWLPGQIDKGPGLDTARHYETYMQVAEQVRPLLDQLVDQGVMARPSEQVGTTDD